MGAMVRIRRRARVWLVAGGCVVLLCAVLGLALAPRVMEQIRAARAERLFEQSLEASAAGNHREAFDRGAAAANMRPEDGRMVRQAARAALDHGHISMGEWWQRALLFPELDVEATTRFAETLLEQGAVAEAHRLLERLAGEAMDDARVTELRIRALRLLRRHGEARRVGETFLESQPAAPGVEVEYLAALLSIPAGDARATAFSRLRAHADADEGVPALGVLRQGVRLPDIDAGLREALLERLHGHPEATRSDRLYARAMQVRFGMIEWASVRDEVYGAFSPGDPAERAELMAWMNSFGLEEEVRAGFSLAEAREDEAALQAYLQALVAGDERDLRRVVEITFEPADALPLSLADIFMWRAQALARLGERGEARSTLRQAADVVELNHFRSLETFLLRHGEWEVLKTLYRRLLDSSMTRALGERRLLMAHYQTGEERELFAMLDAGGFDLGRADASFRGFLAYLEVIHGRNTENARRRLEGLVAEYPAVADFRILLALDYALHRRGALARELLANLPDMPPDSPRHVLFARALLNELLRMGDERLTEAGDRMSGAPLLPREQQLWYGVRAG